MDGFHEHQLFNEPQSGFLSNPAPRLAQLDSSAAKTSATLPPQQLEAELWLERWLNQFGDRLQQSFIACFGQAGVSQVAKCVQAEVEIFQITVNQLRSALNTGIVAIALPDTNDLEASSTPLPVSPFIEETAFKICYLAPPEALRRRVRPHPSTVLVSGQSIRFGLGATIQLEELEDLQQQCLQAAWPISQGCAHSAVQQSTGWLITLVDSETERFNLQDWEIQLRARLIERTLQQMAQSLHQVRLLNSECPQCQKLETRNRELTRANQRKSEFLANTSHEIRTPLSSILGFTHLLREQGYNPSSLRHREYLNIILSSGQHLLALINDILDLSKVEADQLDLQWETVNLGETCRSVLALVKEKASEKRLELRLDVDPNATTFVADPLRLKQMLFNLLSNALKFTCRGSVGLQVKLVGVFLHFTVWDTGSGISKEQQKHLFQPYSQIPNSLVSRDEGTGLGLALTQKLAALHGGWIEVESEVNQGSQFTIVLPLTPQIADTTLSQEIQPATSSTEDATVSLVTRNSTPIKSTLENRPKRLSPKQPPRKVSRQTRNRTDRRAAFRTSKLSAVATPSRVFDVAGGVRHPFHSLTVRPYSILLVEDHAPNAKLIIAFLSKMGYEVTWVTEAQEMWQALEVSLPALILMDVNLPGVDGLSLTQQLKSCERYQLIPVIAQTAMAMTGDRETCLKAGAVDYISKPIDLQALAQLVMRYSDSCTAPEHTA